MPAAGRPQSRDEFEIAIICALSIEFDAVRSLFDEAWDEDGDPYGKVSQDPNEYRTGRMGRDNVVLLLLPGIGKVNAANAIPALLCSYTRIRLALVVGICGGVPKPLDVHGDDDDDDDDDSVELILGDVVVSSSIVQFDFGRRYPHGFEVKKTIEDSVSKAGKDIRSLLRLLDTAQERERLEKKAAKFLEDLQEADVKAAQERGRRASSKYRYIPASEDRLFRATYLHRHRLSNITCGCNETQACERAASTSCKDIGCDENELVLSRHRLEFKRRVEATDTGKAQRPLIHIGAIASGDTVMKSGIDRDRVAREHNIIAFEMEAVGIWDMPSLSCLVVKGICDYADSHKNKRWQTFAAATAAATSKALLALRTRPEAPGQRIKFGSAEAAALTQVELLKTENAALKDQIEFLREALQLELAQRTTPLCRNVDHPQVYIVDALGHSWSLFLDLITSKEGLIYCLKTKFHDVGTRKIEREEWYLVEVGKKWALDFNKPWVAIMTPGKTFNMGMIFRRHQQPRQECPSCHDPNEGKSDEEISCKSCGLNYRRIEELKTLEISHDQGEASTSTASAPEPANEDDIPRPRPHGKRKSTDDEVSYYKRIRLIDMRFEIGTTPDAPESSKVAIHMRYMSDMDRLASYLSRVCGLSEEDCTTALRNSQTRANSTSSTLNELHRLVLTMKQRLETRSQSLLQQSADSQGAGNDVTEKLRTIAEGIEDALRSTPGTSRRTATNTEQTHALTKEDIDKMVASWEPPPETQSPRPGSKINLTTYTWVTVWYCDNCRDGPHTKLILDYCPLCGHRRCPQCPWDEIKRFN
ncbi:hypothetical protein QBC42DRAFT_263380 [Cladorrhinum samala]|uniref:Nucleoside phosphorylase domain-containing protein n=1 Tax=Cladorrhinum samala TaxID=585594 RepID=A0AAV9HUN6_9PEZI|nr:hypothetical protein QBC42DRAFT_263380 [Cladorrhinum samala]